MVAYPDLQLFIGGEWKSADGQPVINPADESVIGTVPHAGTKELDAALEVRTLDRIFDNYVMTPMMTIVFDRMRPEDTRDSLGVSYAREMLDKAYGWLDARMATLTWAAAEVFSLADCAAAPALFYADWVRPFTERAGLMAYFRRLLARPSFARCVDDARPSRHLFPGGAPIRDW